MVPKGRPYLGQLDVDHVAQFTLCVVRHPDKVHTFLASGLEVLVLFGVEKTLRNL